mmetsp:Transcript_8681/g.18457  ORF Transcript_8681/g.18457 Transcript_8681/m.18457 type:complete len:355 (+) Transcript_8681:395-1459(+)
MSTRSSASSRYVSETAAAGRPEAAAALGVWGGGTCSVLAGVGPAAEAVLVLTGTATWGEGCCSRTACVASCSCRAVARRDNTVLRRCASRSLQLLEGVSRGFHTCAVSTSVRLAPFSRGAGRRSAGSAQKSMTSTVMSSCSPFFLRAVYMAMLAAWPAGMLRIWLMTVLGLMASHSPSDDMMRRAPVAGMLICLISGSPRTMLPAAWSPRLRVIIRPPGHTRSGPPGLPSMSDCAIWPPAATTRSRSSEFSDTRWLPLTWMTSAPVSRYAVLSPTLATSSSQPTATASVAVEPLSLKRLRHTSSASTKPACRARGSLSTSASCAAQHLQSSSLSSSQPEGGEGTTGSAPLQRSR